MRPLSGLPGCGSTDARGAHALRRCCAGRSGLVRPSKNGSNALNPVLRPLPRRTSMKRTTLAVALAATVLTSCKKAEEPRQFSQAVLVAALADPARKDQREASDARRKPGPLIAFAGVKPGDKILDLIPGTGYWTRIFSKVVGPEGKVYAVWPQAYAREATGNVADLRKAAAGKYYGNIVVEVQPSTTLTAPEPLDVV